MTEEEQFEEYFRKHFPAYAAGEPTEAERLAEFAPETAKVEAEEGLALDAYVKGPVAREDTMTATTDAERLDRLVDAALAKAEADAKVGSPPSVSELNGLRRLVDRRKEDRELEEMNELARS